MYNYDVVFNLFIEKVLHDLPINIHFTPLNIMDRLL